MRRSKHLPAVLFALLCYSAPGGENHAEQITTLPTVNLARDTVDLMQLPFERILAVAVKRNSCKLCFTELESFLIDSLRCPEKGIFLLAIVQFGDRSLSRREGAAFVRTYLPRFDTTLFAAENPSNVEKEADSLLQDIHLTPAVMILEPNDTSPVKWLKYAELFGGAELQSATGDLSQSAKRRLTEILVDASDWK